MIYIQNLRKNDIGEDHGKQIELGKSFMSVCNWSEEEVSVSICFKVLDNQPWSHLNNYKFTTSFKVRGTERGGDRPGVDCKEYANENGELPIKDFFTNSLHLGSDALGKFYFVLESTKSDNKSFNLYVIGESTLALTMCKQFAQKPIITAPIDIEPNDVQNRDTDFRPYLQAIRTKPFLLLAGISGTGKSRIVRELAFKSCPKYLQDKDGTTPGNYCMIEVKPNWHDSTELLGYYSNLRGQYLFTKFAKFLVKAKMYPDVPFFVCLDEMNLAPVEQYFAEILSILETRKMVGEGTDRTIKTGVVIGAEHFKKLGQVGEYNPNYNDRAIYLKLHEIDTESDIDESIGNRHDLTTEGLTLPHNIIIIGTVNMDDTTHQFSRKVIDRAMTIEMNGGKLRDMFGGSKRLSYTEDEAEQQSWQHTFTQRYVSADEVLEAHADKAEQLMEILPEKLETINKALKGTPFEVSYRVLNELTIMVGVMMDDAPEDALEAIANRALDRILLMKVLPRIEGDSDMFNLKSSQNVNGVTCRNRLEWLRELAPTFEASENEEETAEYQQTAREKIEEMIERLDNQEFTRFWP